METKNIVLIVGALIVVGLLWKGGTVFAPEAAAPTEVTTAEVTTPTVGAPCQIEDISLKYNDMDFYKKGTDPAANLYILSGDVSPQAINDDGTLTVGTDANIKGLAGENSSTYFSEIHEFNSNCVDPYYLTADLKLSSAPTVTIVNDDGVTKNSNGTNSEDISASSSYVAEFTVRSGAENCASNTGAVLACEYDATYVQKIEAESGDIEESDYAMYQAHGSHEAATFDQWKTFMYPNELCDGAKDVFAIKYTTTASIAGASNEAAINCTWYALDYDKDEDTYEVLGPAIYDEDNNLVGLAFKPSIIYTK